ncbi:MAG: hypothetical protein R2882_14610 [Gemmatimonadales bacterium]
MLQRLFGTSHHEIWKRLAAQIGGDYTPGNFWRGDRVTVSHDDWTIVLDSYTTKVPFTRFRAEVSSPDGFRFAVSRRGLLSDLAHALGAQDVVVGHEPFDRDFVIKGNDEAKLRALFDNARIRAGLDAQPDVHFDLAEAGGTVFLSFATVGLLDDPARLRAQYDLFADTLDALGRAGSAEPPPNAPAP